MRPDLAGGVAWLAAGAWMAWEACDLGLGSAHDPGSGFVLFWAGLLLAALALVQLATAVRGGGDGAAIGGLWRGADWRKPLLAVVVLTGYAAALQPLGFLVSTALFLLILLLAIEPTRPPVAVLLAVGTSAAVWGLFDRLLGVGLPRGVLGF